MLNQIIAEAEKLGWTYISKATMEVNFSGPKGQSLTVFGTMDMSIEWVMKVEGQKVADGDGWTLPTAKQF